MGGLFSNVEGSSLGGGVDDSGECKVLYFIAMTPRSGSSYLCDLLSRMGRFGDPREYLNPAFVPRFLKHVRSGSADQYLCQLMDRGMTKNGVSGLKGSWFHMRRFLIESDGYIDRFKFIYLRRRDVISQAVSLFKAAETGFFHTNIIHGNDVVEKFMGLEYSFDDIEKWYKHILEQEAGWEDFFYKRNIFPMNVFYEEIERDVLSVIRRIGGFLGLPKGELELPEKPSVFRRVRDQRNIEWAQQFARDLANKEEQLPKVFGVDA